MSALDEKLRKARYTRVWSAERKLEQARTLELERRSLAEAPAPDEQPAWPEAADVVPMAAMRRRGGAA